MNIRTNAHAASLAALAAALTLGAVGCEQPSPKCQVFTDFDHGGMFGARYTLVEGSKTGEGTCDELVGETLHFGNYYARGENNAPDYDKVSVAIEPGTITDSNVNLVNSQGWGYNAEIAPEINEPYTMGRFDSSDPDSNDMCSLSEFGDPARHQMPTVPGWIEDWGDGTVIDHPEAAPVDVTYEFSNLQVYVTPASPGRQLSADLTFTSGSCSAKYKVRAIFPATFCGVEDVDADGNPVLLPSDEVCETTEVFKDDLVECDPNTYLCVPKDEIPSLR